MALPAYKATLKSNKGNFTYVLEETIHEGVAILAESSFLLFFFEYLYKE
jgi:hypothetical protein